MTVKIVLSFALKECIFSMRLDLRVKKYRDG